MSKLSILVLCFIISNLKIMPLAFHLRFYYYVFKNFYLFKNRKRRSIFDKTTLTTFTPMMEMDFNFHKSNSTYFSDSDISRTDLLTLQLRNFYLNFSDPDAPKMRRSEFIYSPLGSNQMIYRKEIPGYTLYNVESRIIGWTSKWLYVLTAFKNRKNGSVYAVGVSKYVFKQKRKTIAPEAAIKFEGLLTEEAIAKNLEMQKFFNDSLSLEEIVNLA